MTAEQFAWWLVGLVDGEGHFGITRDVSRRLTRPYYRCVFRVAITASDRGMLDAARERTGWGVMYDHAPRTRRQRPSVVWSVTTKQVGAVAEFFERHPLQSEKARDFAIWAPAARAQVARTQRGRGHRDDAAASVMETAYEAMRELRSGRRAMEAA